MEGHGYGGYNSWEPDVGGYAHTINSGDSFREGYQNDYDGPSYAYTVDTDGRTIQHDLSRHESSQYSGYGSGSYDDYLWGENGGYNRSYDDGWNGGGYAQTLPTSRGYSERSLRQEPSYRQEPSIHDEWQESSRQSQNRHPSPSQYRRSRSHHRRSRSRHGHRHHSSHSGYDDVWSTPEEGRGRERRGNAIAALYGRQPPYVHSAALGGLYPNFRRYAER